MDIFLHKPDLLSSPIIGDALIKLVHADQKIKAEMGTLASIRSERTF